MVLPHNTRAELCRYLIRAIEQGRLRELAMAPAEQEGPHAMMRLIARVLGVCIETADMLVNEVLSRHLRDGKAIARYAGLTGSPDESGKRRREKGLARAGNARPSWRHPAALLRQCQPTPCAARHGPPLTSRPKVAMKNRDAVVAAHASHGVRVRHANWPLLTSQAPTNSWCRAGRRCFCLGRQALCRRAS
jgi:hypothetical protein